MEETKTIEALEPTVHKLTIFGARTDERVTLFDPTDEEQVAVARERCTRFAESGTIMAQTESGSMEIVEAFDPEQAFQVVILPMRGGGGPLVFLGSRGVFFGGYKKALREIFTPSQMFSK